MIEIFLGLIVMIIGEFFKDASAKKNHEDGIILLDLDNNSDSE